MQALGVVILYIHRTEPTLSLPCLPVVGETPLLHLTLFSLFQNVKELIYFDTSNIVLSFDGKNENWFFLHRWRDSNSHQRFWRPVCYHCTTPIFKERRRWFSGQLLLQSALLWFIPPNSDNNDRYKLLSHSYYHSPINLCWQGGIRTPVLRRDLIYSQAPLTTRPPTNLFFFKSFPLQIKSNSNQDIHTERSHDLMDVFINVHGEMNVANHPKRNGKI